MKKIYRYTLLPICLFTITGCTLFESSSLSSDLESSSSSDITSSSSNNSSSSEASSEDISDSPALVSSEDYLKFWNPTTNLHIEVSMSEDAANFINDYQSSTDSRYHDFYVPCTFRLTMDDQVIEMDEVGIRQKGNLSRTHMLEDNHFSLNSLAHYKFSFKETFDDDEYTSINILQPFKKTWEDDSARKKRKKRTLFDMEKIDIKWNRNNDESKTKQTYALKTFRDNGVLAGNDTLSKVSLSIVGDTPITTTYEVMECIDSVFIKRHFNNEYADGDLYKCTYTDRGPANFSTSYTVGNQIGVEDNYNWYHPSYDLKTNKKKNTTHDKLRNLISVINDKTSSANTYKNKIQEVLDMNSFMMYESIAYLLGNFDDLRNNSNNYYLYFPSEMNKAYIIPYDFDRCLGAGCEGRQDYMTNFSPESTKMQCNGDWQNQIFYWRTVCKTTESSSGYANIPQIEEYRAMYQSNIENLLNNQIISTQSFTQFVNSFPSAYRGNPNGAGNNNTTFANYLTKKIQAIRDSNSKGLINYNIEV